MILKLDTESWPLGLLAHRLDLQAYRHVSDVSGFRWTAVTPEPKLLQELIKYSRYYFHVKLVFLMRFCLFELVVRALHSSVLSLWGLFSEGSEDVCSELMNDEEASAGPPQLRGLLRRIVQSFISSNSVSFTSCSPDLHENRLGSCELPQPIDPAPQTWIAVLWGSPASQIGFSRALSPNHGNLIYLEPPACFAWAPPQFVLGMFSASHLIGPTQCWFQGAAG